MSTIKQDKYTDEQILDYVERTYEPEELISLLGITTEDLLDIYEDLVMEHKEEIIREMDEI